MNAKLIAAVAALTLGSTLFAEPCRCGCAADKDVLAEEEDDAFVSGEFGLAFD